MELKDMNIKYDIDSAHTDIEKKAFCRINARNLEKKNHCTKCGNPLREKGVTSKKIYDYRSEPIIGDAHLYIIELESQRYKCKNPKCCCTFTAGELPREFTYTDSFREYIGFSLLSDDKLNMTALERKLSLSHSLISKIFSDYVKNLNLHFTPHRNRRYLYLHEFYYKNKKRYYLVKVTNSFIPHIIAFFGYEDCDDELIEYFRFHWEKADMLDAFLTLYTEKREPFYSMLLPYVSFLTIKPSRIEIDALLKSKIYNPKGRLQFAIYDYITSLNKCMLSKSYKHDFRAWWSKILNDTKHDNIKEMLEPVRRFLIEHPNYHEYYKEFDIKYELLNDSISKHESQNISFDKMCGRLMYQTQGKYLFENEEFNYSIKHDKVTNLFYRDAALDDEELEQLNMKRKAELMKQLDETKNALQEKAKLLQDQLYSLDDMSTMYYSDDVNPFERDILNDDFSTEHNIFSDLLISEKDIDDKFEYISNEMGILKEEIDKYQFEMKKFKRSFKLMKSDIRISIYDDLQNDLDELKNELKELQWDFEDVDNELFESGYNKLLEESDESSKIINSTEDNFIQEK